MKNYKIVLTESEIQKRVKELGEEISRDYKGKKPIVVCMLKGAIVFFADIVRNLDLPIYMEFARLSSYRNGTTSGDLEVIVDITPDIEGKDIIIIEDVVDSGKTLCIIEAMKVMNEIKASEKVKIVKILIENGQPVNAQQALFAVEKL